MVKRGAWKLPIVPRRSYKWQAFAAKHFAAPATFSHLEAAIISIMVNSYKNPFKTTVLGYFTML